MVNSLFHNIYLGQQYAEKRGADQHSIQNSFAVQNKRVQKQIIKKFEIAYFVAKEELPLTKYQSLIELEEHHSIDHGNAYRNRIECGIFIDSIGDVFKADLHKAVSNANFYSVLWDGTTDISVQEKETMFILYLDKGESSESVKVETKFLGLATVAYAHAPGILNEIKERLKNVGKYHTVATFEK